jgi:hypothetical protein
MAGTGTRRLRLAAAASGLTVVAVLATPSLAGAQSEPTTTAAPSTTSTTVGTTTTTAPVQVPDLDVYAPGDKLTVSGTGCLVNGTPGVVMLAIANATSGDLYGPPVTAKPDGSFTITVTLPLTLPDGLHLALPGCFPVEGGQGLPLDKAQKWFLVQRPGTPSEPEGEIKQETGAAKANAVTKVAAPKAVKSKPKFTG